MSQNGGAGIARCFEDLLDGNDAGAARTSAMALDGTLIVSNRTGGETSRLSTQPPVLNSLECRWVHDSHEVAVSPDGRSS
ncbi:MAG: hypothetical protein CM1200mP36_11040 [Gammaproteobacteria bacterium]|nr:MAG: hypothetical protein CM1200mP36_11040 [Gammaproteobacteria bacterium]